MHSFSQQLADAGIDVRLHRTRRWFWRCLHSLSGCHQWRWERWEIHSTDLAILSKFIDVLSLTLSTRESGKNFDRLASLFVVETNMEDLSCAGEADMIPGAKLSYDLEINDRNGKTKAKTDYKQSQSNRCLKYTDSFAACFQLVCPRRLEWRLKNLATLVARGRAVVAVVAVAAKAWRASSRW